MFNGLPERGNQHWWIEGTCRDCGAKATFATFNAGCPWMVKHNMKFWYLATPYSKYPDGIEAAFHLAAETRGILLKAGVPCFSPIVHSHPVAMVCRIDPLDHSIWLPSEAPILRLAHGLIMLRARSWEVSYGMAEEYKLFIAAGKPVVFMDPGVVPEGLTDS